MAAVTFIAKLEVQVLLLVVSRDPSRWNVIINKILLYRVLLQQLLELMREEHIVLIIIMLQSVELKAHLCLIHF